ncbi:MAG: inositol-3-phosphate synthase [Gammaproteobacteria bacterium]
MSTIKIGIVGLGNCASALIQGIYYYRNRDPQEAFGLLHWEIGGYRPFDIDVVAAFDVDVRKVGKDVSEALFAPPNCTTVFCEHIPSSDVTVRMGAVLDGVSAHMRSYDERRSFVPAKLPEPSQDQVVRVLKEAGTEVLVNYLPVGSERATRFYAECALEAGCAFVNNIPVFIASDPRWASRFEKRGIPIIGDDIKAQLGATITHRALVDLFKKRGVKLERTYQLNTGGNTDFLNMLNRERLASKKKSKTEAVQAVAASRLADTDIHVGPSDYVPWQKDNKVCFIRMEGTLFGDVPMNLELRLSVEDSPNSASIAIDAIRCVRLALDRHQGGVLNGPAGYFCKHPLRQYSDEEAYRLTEAFIKGTFLESMPAESHDDVPASPDDEKLEAAG